MKKIVNMILFHCAKGATGCEKCKALAAQGEKYCLINLEPRGGIISRPMVNLNNKGEDIWYEYDIINIFENEKEARDYSKKNDIEIIKR
ncbi:MAG: hypothetical protein ACFFBP_19100 [Promethearchaeota archaeon]